MAEIPLFPLPLVLFPGGKLALQIFETRYLDMIRQCMKDSTGFGIVLIKEGAQVLSGQDQQLPSVAHCGTYCEIVDFDQQRNGLLQVMVQGQVKFSIRDQYENPNRLMLGQVELLPLETETPVPENKAHLVAALRSLIQHEQIRSLGLTIDFANAGEVGARLTEFLPCPDEFKQRMLELKDPQVRLSELEKQLLRMQE